MSAYTAEQLGEILAKHRKWICDEEGGSRANLSGADLSGADLSGANLYGANLYGANLSGANLRNIGGREVNTFLSVAGIGREGRQTLFWVEEDKVWCGCFTGTLAEFEAKIQDQHGDNAHGQNYRDAVTFFNSVVSRLAPVVKVQS